MSYTYHELKEKTVAELRQIAAGLDSEAVKGYTQLNKEHLLLAICKALGIDTKEHHHAVLKNKIEIKGKIRLLKKARQEAIASGDRKKLTHVRQQISSLKKRLRRSMV